MINRYFSLQLFAEGEGDGATGEPEGNGSGAAAEQNAGASHLSFDDFLAQGGQAEFDRRVQKATQTAVANAQKKWETIADDRVSEAEKLASMNAEQREKYRADKAERELADLRRQIAKGDMAKTARKMLAESGISIPDELVLNLVCEDAEKPKEAVEGFSEAFKNAVQDAVKEALKGKTPRASSGSSPTVTREQILAVKDRAERQRLIAENPQLFVRSR